MSNARIRERSPYEAYHLVVRAHRREMIFQQDDVRDQFFLNSMEAFKKNKVDVLQFTIMGNHAHFFAMGELDNIPSVFRSIGATFCRWFNHENGYKGAVFDSRYYLGAIKSEQQFVNCLAYIANNPVRSGIVDKAECYEYSSFKHIFKPFYPYTNNQRLYKWVKPAQLVEAVRDMLNPNYTIDPLTPLKPSDFDALSRIGQLYEGFDGTNFTKLEEDKQKAIIITLIHENSNAYQIARVTGLKYNRVRKFLQNCVEKE